LDASESLLACLMQGQVPIQALVAIQAQIQVLEQVPVPQGLAVVSTLSVVNIMAQYPQHYASQEASTYIHPRTPGCGCAPYVREVLSIGQWPNDEEVHLRQPHRSLQLSTLPLAYPSERGMNVDQK
jgi:hypothetical protein